MKANELRIGNWYEEDGRPFKVTWMTIRDVFNDKAGATWCKPITLTEEWLVRFGFKKRSHKTAADYFAMKSLIIRLKGDIAQTRTNGGYMADIQYVHQLQNLYFALTGEELTNKDANQ